MSQRRELLAGAILVGVSVGIYLISLSFPALPEGYPGPSLFPQIIAIGLGLMGIILGITSLRNKPSDKDISHQDSQESSLWRMLGGLGLIALYPLLYPYVAPLQYTWGLGFNPIFIVMGLILWAFARLTRVSFKASLLLALLGPIFVYLIFTQLLGVSL